MRRSLPLFFACVCMGTMLSAAEYAAYQQPFLPTGQLRKASTKKVLWKSATLYQGNTVSLHCYTTGMPNWYAPDNRTRYGGITLNRGKEAMRGKRVDGFKDPNRAEFAFDEAPTLKFLVELNDKNEIECTLSDPKGLSSYSFSHAFLGEFFGGAAVKIGEKTFTLPPYDPNGPSYHKNFFSGPATSILFFSGREDREFEIRFPGPQRIKFASSNSLYSHNVEFFAAPGAKELKFTVIPGTVAAAQETTPKDTLTAVGPYNFWGVDHLRLPDNTGKNLLSNGSFEAGFQSLWQSHIGGGVSSKALWDNPPIQLDDTDAFHGKTSIRFFSDAGKKGFAQHFAVHPVILTPGDYTISFYAKTDKPGKQRMELDNIMLPPGSSIWSGSAHNRTTFNLTQDWQRYSYTFKVPVTQPHYFVIAAKSDEPAVAHVDALQMEKGSSATDFTTQVAESKLATSEKDNFFQLGQAVNAKLEILTAKPNAAGKVTTTVTDFFGRVVRTARNEFTSDAFCRADVALDLEKLPQGIFVIENRYAMADGTKHYEFFRFSVMKYLDNTHKNKHMFCNTYIDMFAPHQNLRDVLKRYQRIGIGSRSGIADTQKVLADEAKAYGVDSVTGWIAHTDRELVKDWPKPCAGFAIQKNITWFNSLSDNFKEVRYGQATLPLGKTDLKAVEEAAARRTKENPFVIAWSPLGEIEGMLPEFADSRFTNDERYQQYIDLHLALVRGAKKGNPNAQIANDATSCIREDRFATLDKFFRAVGDKFHYDCFIFHVYREAPEYPDLDADFQRLDKMLTGFGYPDEPIYCSEGMHWKPYRMPGLFPVDWVATPWGAISYDMGHEERVTAAWRVRTWLIGLKNKRVKLINSSTNFWGFEMDMLLTPYANQKSSNTLGQLLGNADFVKEFRLSAKSRCYLFKDEQGRPVAAVWSCDPEVDRGIKKGPALMLEKTLPGMELIDMMGNPYEMKATVELSSFPVFFRGPAGSEAAFSALLDSAELAGEGESALGSVFRVSSPSKYQAQFTNNGKHDFKGKIANTALTLAPGKKYSLTGVLPSVLTDKRLTSEEIAVEILQNKPRRGKFIVKDSFSGLLVKQADIRVDGNDADWNNVPAIKLEARERSVRSEQQKQEPYETSLKFAWGKNGFLYMLVDVTDPVHVVKEVQRKSSGWMNDSLQIFIDTFADGRHSEKRGFGIDDWSYGFYLDPATQKPYVWRHVVPDGQLTGGTHAPKTDSLAPDVQFVFTKTANGYRYEIGFPPSALLPFRMEKGGAIGLGVQLNNQNGTSTNPQEFLYFVHKFTPNDRPDLFPLLLFQ